MQNNRNNLDDELHRILTSYLNNNLNNLNNVFNTRNRPPTTPQYRHGDVIQTHRHIIIYFSQEKETIPTTQFYLILY